MLQWTYTKPLGYQAPVTVGDISGSLMIDSDMILVTLCTPNEELMYSFGRALHTDDLKARADEIGEKLIINPGIIGLTIGLIIFLFSIPTPEIINKTDLLIIPLNKNSIDGMTDSVNALKMLFFLKQITQIVQ